jgi:hexosaminidase
MYDHGMKTNEDLQTYFNSRLLKILTQHHKKMVGWDEILHPGLPKTIVVHSWRGADSLVESAKKGYDTILSNGYYLDNMRSAGFHYNVDPLPAKTDLTAEQRSHVLGGEACMWSEYVSPETIDSRIWPRTLAVAERLWSPAGVHDMDNFYDRMEVESGRLGELGLIHHSNYLPVLQKLAGDQPVEPLKVLADVLEPMKLYERPHTRAYTTETPLDRLVDAVRPESLIAHYFRISVDSYLKGVPHFGDFEGLQKPLQTWADNHKALEPLLKKSGSLLEAAFQSKDLSAIAALGLEAVQFLKSGKQAPASWQEKAVEALKRAEDPHSAVEIAVISPIRKLTLAASQLDKLKEMSGEEWNKSLDDQVKAGKRKTWE